jgi:uncharacterized flavoprotein (TIGR03862 family)
MVIGAGPAGLMAAQVLGQAHCTVEVIDRMPTVGRKLLRAGVGGLNLTHAEPFEQFVTRYGTRSAQCRAWLSQWGQAELMDWTKSLGIDTFVGSSQRVFPVGMKAAPLLRAWLRRLQSPAIGSPVKVLTRHRWEGGLRRVSLESGGAAWEVSLHGPDGPIKRLADVVVLAMGGGSWPQLGSDGTWWPWMNQLAVDAAPLAPANCGFDVKTQSPQGWSDHFAKRFAGAPLKTIALGFETPDGYQYCQRGELVVTRTGLEGSLVYAASSLLREIILQNDSASIHLDLKPDWTLQRVSLALEKERNGKSLSWVLKSRLGLTALQTALLYEVLPPSILTSPTQLAQGVKHFPLVLARPRPIAEAISTAGGVKLEGLDTGLMVKHLPGVFVAGEMLDWEAPTGGYLLTASLSSGWIAGQAAARWLQQPPGSSN